MLGFFPLEMKETLLSHKWRAVHTIATVDGVNGS